MNRKIIGVFVSMLLFATIFTVADPIEISKMSAPIKWEQLPDDTENGIDIRIDINDGIMRTVADDFECISTEPITDVHFWGSWKHDIKGDIRRIHLSIHEDIPQGPGGYSMPGALLWELDVFDFDESMYSDVPGEWWWDPITGELIPAADFVIWQYDVYIDPVVAFIQQGTPSDPMVYWLDIYVELLAGTAGEFGWKTSIDHWNDDAVYYINDNPYWIELRYPQGHPYYPESIDMSFRITGEDEPIPNLACEGVIEWVNVKPGDTKTDTFEVKNIGDPGSLLNWQVTSWPAWGNWTFTPSSGIGLPEGFSIIVTATCVAPNQQNQQFTGDIEVCNTDDSTDCCTIPVSLKTPKTKQVNQLLVKLLERLLELFPILNWMLDS